MERLVRKNRMRVLRMDRAILTVGIFPTGKRQPLFLENAFRTVFECAVALTCINSVNRIR